MKAHIKVATLAVILSAMWLYRYFSFNMKIAELYTTPRETYEMADLVEYGEDTINLHDYCGCSLKVKGALLMDGATYLSGTYGITETDSLYSARLARGKICLIEIEFRNCSKYPKSFETADLLLCGKDSAFGIPNTVYDLDPQWIFRLDTSPGEITTAQIPFFIDRDAFTEKEWSHMEQYELYLVITQLPVEKVIRVKYSDPQNA